MRRNFSLQLGLVAVLGAARLVFFAADLAAGLRFLMSLFGSSVTGRLANRVPLSQRHYYNICSSFGAVVHTAVNAVSLPCS